MKIGNGLILNVYRIWDTKEKTWVNDIFGERLVFPTIESAYKYKDGLLDSGDYPDEPHTVYDIRAVKIENR